MSRLYEKRIRPAAEYLHLTGVRCDLCLAPGRAAGEYGKGSYDVGDTALEVAVHSETGSRYPDSGSVTKLAVDICPTCFKLKLIPWLRSQGVQIQEHEVDW